MIEDPSVLGDAAVEPKYDPDAVVGESVHPASPRPVVATKLDSGEGAEDEGSGDEEPPLLRTGHPVRDRLLAKARAAKQEVAVSETVLGDDSGPLGQVESELLKIASSARPSMVTPIRIGGAPLSSAAVLLLGTIFGLAGFALMFALLIEFAPRSDRDGQGLATIAPTAETDETIEDAPEATYAPAPPPPRPKVEGPWRIEEAKEGQRVVRGSMGKDPFLKAIQDAGLNKTQAYRVYTALKDEKNLDRCRPSDEFIALLDRADGRVLAFEYVASREEVYQAKEGDDGLLRGKQLDLQVKRARVQGAIVMMSSSFAESARASHFDPGLGVVINKAFQGHIGVEEFKLGDRIRVVAQEVTVLGEFYRYAGIEAIEYMPADGTPLRAYYFENKKRYYDAKGRAPGEGGWRRPVEGAPITSKFNPARLHPILKKKMPHNGTDFGAPTGTPVYASSSGTIRKRGDYGPNGNFIGIEHHGGYETGYSHLSRFEPGLNVGDSVKRLQVIGYVGSTGRSTGPHLHFSAKKDGKFIDPESLGLDALTTLPANELSVFRQVQEKYNALLDEIPLPPPLVRPNEVANAEPNTVTGTERSDPLHDFEEEGESADDSVEQPSIVPAAPIARAPVAQAPAAAQQQLATLPAKRTSSALYMTDKELMEAQSRSDDGEVDE